MKIVFLPPVPALLPEYAGRIDPVPGLRAAATRAVSWLAGPARVICDPPSALDAARGVEVPLGLRVSHSLGVWADPNAADLVVILSGAATHTEKAPGFFDPRASAFDAAIDDGLRRGDIEALKVIDVGLAAQLWASGIAGLPVVAELVDSARPVSVDYADAPYGVGYWVARWEATGR